MFRILAEAKVSSEVLLQNSDLTELEELLLVAGSQLEVARSS